MPPDVSSSSSEDEAEAPTVESGERNDNSTQKTKTRYKCPSDFVTFSHKQCRSMLTNDLRNSNKRELWLIKAPAGFNPESFSGGRVALAGLHTLRIPGAESEQQKQQRYNVLASERCPSELRLLTADRLASDRLGLGPAFCGLLNVCESYEDGDAEARQTLTHVLPKAPALTIPSGLKLRFHLGDGQAVAPSVMPGDEPDSRRSGKKRKRVKHAKEVVEVKQEVLDDEDESSRRRKSKKKKKEKEREDGLELDVMLKEEPLKVKSEPADTACSNVSETDAMATKKKKKKKKKSIKHEED